MKTFIHFLPIIFLLCGIEVAAKAPISGNLNSAEQMQVGRVLGFGSAMKVLGNPYPLGGFDGYEFGIMTGFIPRDQISKLGNGQGENSEISYLELSISKGLYKNIDVGITFSPFPQTESYSSFGAFGRIGIWEGEHYPASFSLNLHTNFASFYDMVHTTTGGLDGIFAVSVEKLSLYLGLGWLDSNATLIGGASGITNTQKTLTAGNSSPRQFAGFSISFGKIFTAFQVDRSDDSYYSGKLGLRL
ncbi:MAG TPA: hypothetical protein PLU50_12525 [Pseudobdellovibrionaceae bacterium]|nr:hypothetical protein [Pseudobdellovibrionaceae bacterium]